MNRRQWLGGVGASLVAARGARVRASGEVATPDAPKGKMPLDLSDYQPKSMLHVAENKVPRSRYPVIDVHTHFAWLSRNEGANTDEVRMQFLAEPKALLEVMDRKNIQTMVNLTGGYGAGMEETIQKYQAAHPKRFLIFTEPQWHRLNDPNYSQFQADEIERACKTGAGGLKITKTLGLYLREGITTGPLVKIDDRRLDPMWEVCGALKIPVSIHISDPEAFFLAIDRFNERFEELNNHPDWSFHGKDFPSNRDLLEARNRVYARHPKTHFNTLHVGNDAEDLPYVAECMDRFPNMSVELGARIGELGRQPRAARKFFEKYQDRIMFGTDAVPSPQGLATPQQIFGDELYEIYYRFLETEDEYFDYAPAPVPPQGRWRIYGLGLPDKILRKVYHDNAARMLSLGG